ncbi:MAG: hypothetical protein P8K80_04585 [Phycisphaerales bacterium]|nr:hypothetical protein [Phycisphaerales bacterium]
MRHRLAIIGAGVLLATTASTTADTLDVCEEGCTYSTIQSAIDAASEGDRIEIGPGTYYENLNIDGKGIHLVGLAGRDATFVDAQFSGRCLYITAAPTEPVVLEGITFQKGRTDHVPGAGIDADSTVHMRDCAVIKCVVYGSNAGGISVGGDNSLLTNVLIQGNTAGHDTSAYRGGGCYITGNGTTLINCLIEGNRVETTYSGDSDYVDGGGCYINATNVTIESTMIRNNSVIHAGSTSYLRGSGIYSAYSYPFYMNNSIVCGNIGDDQINGAFSGSNNLVSDVCNAQSEPYGACCTDAGCVDVDNQYHCVLIGGTFAGPYSDCETTECGAEDAFGACCIGGNCIFIMETDCTEVLGQWQGAFVTCQTTVCTPPPPYGACCYGGSCTELTEEVCLDLLGEWRGADTACIDEDCSIPPATGACCVASGCVEVTMAECFAAPGIYAGDDTACDGTECPGSCYGDVNEDGSVNVNDLLIVIAAWGPCP